MASRLLRSFSTRAAWGATHLRRNHPAPWRNRNLCTSGFAIDELKKELEKLFGQQRGGVVFEKKKKKDETREEEEEEDSDSWPRRLSHADSRGSPRMVDVSEKMATHRVAVASCRVELGQDAFAAIAAETSGERQGGTRKGDVLGVAKIAGINAAKQTCVLIPLCHNIMLSHVQVHVLLNEQAHSVDITAQASAVAATGVEMEAMTAASVAGLTVYDMCKALSKHIRISNVQLESKSGGKSGNWRRNQSPSHP